MLPEKLLHCPVEVKSVLLVMESVSFVVLDHVVDIFAGLLDGLDNLV